MTKGVENEGVPFNYSIVQRRYQVDFQLNNLSYSISWSIPSRYSKLHKRHQLAHPTLILKCHLAYLTVSRYQITVNNSPPTISSVAECEWVAGFGNLHVDGELHPNFISSQYSQHSRPARPSSTHLTETHFGLEEMTPSEPGVLSSWKYRTSLLDLKLHSN
jgi:hypothetical protein